MKYKEYRIKPKNKGYFQKYKDFIFEKTSKSCSLDEHSWLCRERKAILFPLYFVLKIFYFLKNILLIIRLGYFELLYFAHLRVRYIHDTVYQKNKSYKKVNDYKYTRPVRKATILGFVFSFVIFQFMGSLWPEFFNPTHPKVAEGANASVTWTDQTHFEGSTPPSGAASGATTRSNVDTSGTPGDVKLSTTSNFGDGSDGPLTTNASFNINTQTNGYNGRTLADGGVSTLGPSAGSGTSALTLALSAFLVGGGIAVGDEILIAKFWKVGDTTTGVSEIKTVSSADITNLTLSSPLENSYPTGSLVQRVPNYSSMDIGATGTVTASDWDGSTGGVVVFRVQGTLTIASGGKIDTSGLGYTDGNGPGKGGIAPDMVECDGYGDPCTSSGGGGYGGTGGTGEAINGGASNGGVSYGSPPNNYPDLGSGGGSGDGGGLTYAFINNLNSNGSIVSSGEATGAGGGIYLLVGGITSKGTLSANGGNGGYDFSGYGNGGGGGGRIRIVTGSDPGVTNISASGGTGGASAQPGAATSPTYTYSAPTYNTSGSISGFKIDAGSGKRAKWSSVSWTGSEPTNTDIKFRTRGADTEGGLTSATWSSYYTVSGSSITTTASEWLEIETTLTSDGSATPTLSDFTVAYDTIDNPDNANLTLKKANGTTSLKTSGGLDLGAGVGGGFTNETSVKLTASGLTCTGCGASTNIRPEVEAKPVATPFDGTGTFTAAQGSTTATVTGLSVGAYHMRVRAVDDEGRVSGWTSYASDATAFTVETTAPTQPGTPTAGGAQTTDNTPTWTWTASTDAGSGIGYYKVYWDTVAGGESNTVNVATNSYTHSIVLADGTWHFKVLTYDNAGNVSTASENGSVVIDSEAPTNVSGLSGYTDNGKGTAVTSNLWTTDRDPYFEWSASTDSGSGIDHYEYYFGTDLNGVPSTTNGNITTYQVGSQQTIGTYYFKVVAVDVAGNPSATPTTFIYKTDYTNPNPPTGLNLTDRQDTSLNVAWTAPVSTPASGVESYEVQRKLEAQVWGSAVTLSPGTATSYNDTGLSAGTRYTYRVRTVSNSGLYSSWAPSDAGEVFYTVDSTPPTVPVVSSVNACDAEGNNCSDPSNKGYELKLTWTASTDSASGLDHYRIYRKESSNSNDINDFNLVGVVTNPLQVTYYDNDTNNDDATTWVSYGKTEATTRLNDYAAYHYRIVAYDVAGNSTNFYSLDLDLDPTGTRNHGSATTADITPPSIPVGLSVDPMAYNQVYLSWAASTDTRTIGRTPEGNGSGVQGYKVYRKRTNPTPEADFVDITANICTEPCNDNTLTDSYNFGANGAETFEYKVYAYDATGNPTVPASYFTGVVTTTTPNNSQPSAPGTVTVTTTTGDPASSAVVGHENTVTFVGSSLPTGAPENNFRVGSYKVYRSTTPSGTYTEIATVNLGGTLSYDETGATYTYIDNDTSNNDTASGQSESYLTRAGSGGSTSYTVTKSATGVLDDATSYYYKIKSFSNDATPLPSTFSSVNGSIPHTGWDTTADDTAPDTPSNVEVKNLNPGEDYIRNIITWSRISTPTRGGSNDFREYRIYRRAEDEMSFTQLTVDGNNMLYRTVKSEGMDTNYYVDAIAEGVANKNYYYFIVAVDDAGTEFKYSTDAVINAYNNISAASSTVSINPGTVNPTVSPASITVSSLGVSSATINWTTDQQTDSLVEYRVETSNDVVAAGKDRTQPTTSHSVPLGNLSKGTAYQYRIVSRNSLGNIDEAAATTWRDFSTQDFSITNPTDITTTSTATIKWNTNINADSYVEYKLEGSQDKFLVAGDSTATTSHEVTIKSLRPNSRYTYNLRSVTSDNYIATENLKSFKTRDNDLDKFKISPAETNVSEQNVTATTAQITWVTTVATTSWVEYGTEVGVYSMSAGDNDLNTLHAVKLTNLRPGTKYFYRVRGKDENGVELFSPESSFTAILMPEISNLRVREFGSYTATITFDTNVDAVVSVNYGKDGSYGSSVSVAKAEKNHVVTLKDLDDNATYHFQASVIDQFKNNVKSPDTTFSTPLDTQGPEVSELKVDVLPISESSETASAIVSWTTDKPSTTLVEYDDKGSGEKYEEQTTEDTSLNTSHTVMIKELNTSSNYRFRIVAKDKRGNLTKTKSSTFITPTKEKSLLQIIIKSLEDTFSWTKNVPSFFGRVGNRLMGK